ncbi:MAG: class I SAM-dependent methyltransferase [Candidatus Obscuribacterales bacterium]
MYRSGIDKSHDVAERYLATHRSTHRYLAYRDLNNTLERYSIGKRALDYGAGLGYSAEVLSQLGLEVTAVDISKEMVALAATFYPHLPYFLIRDGKVPLSNNSQDVVLSSFVLFELSSRRAILSYLEEAQRVLCPKTGILIAITGSEQLHCPIRNWLLFDPNYPENYNRASGSTVKLRLREADLEFEDYFWTEADYRQEFSQAGFDILEIQHPVGYTSEPYEWRDERNHSPYTIFIAKTNT